MHRRAYLAAVAGGGFAGLAGCTALGSLGNFGVDNYDIGMTRNEFVPDEYEVTVGETVVWKNTSGSLHTVTAYEGSIPDGAEYFASGGYDSEEEAREAWHDDFGGGFDPDALFEHTFEVPGTYSYFCIPHEMDGHGAVRMDGLVHVTE
ncbi:cupredoxin domain-containing protein [Natrialbaceae archaeon AArc-T1-2]|uniref:cupredoxin domain-containing protein n=1 Tax=Natrialbaceae archaeon AArc-T1-2 TaxID=3053904 RepID=UPI00255B3D13|nr:plastocyanin/azurin family copper-binding protein [Natrialbaceae archaeon AArc-T1-2]WIV66942.1 plastocyanin/azurin family copper-binding protein [Natrialbaceae archaeon AArc-T1-2]